MKQLLLLITTLLTTFHLWAQVGIGTTNPQEMLHIAGPNSTIRIESLNSINSPTENDGTSLVPLFVDGKGDITFGNGYGTGVEPFNFLIDIPDFIDDNPYGIGNSGIVVNNNNLGESTVEGLITTVLIDVPQDAMVETKYGITMIVSGNDITTGSVSYPTYDVAITMATYFVVDIDSDGLSAAEQALKYGHKGQAFETNYGGTIGYPYMNSQAYFTLPAGSHTLYFYGVVNDSATTYTSVGFGGDKDYLKIRIYN